MIQFNNLSLKEVFHQRLGYGLFLLLLSFVLMPVAELDAQITADFEGLSTTQNCTNVTCFYTDPDDPMTPHALQDVGGIPVNAASSGSELGFTSSFRPSRTGSSQTGLSDGDGFGVAGSAFFGNFLGGPPPSGSQGFFIQDTDGEVTITFDPVDLTGTSSPSFSMQYHIESTGYEVSDGQNDRLYIRLDVTGCGAATTVSLLDTDGGGSGGGGGGDIDALSIENSWNPINEDLSPYVGCVVTLVVEADFNSSSEEAAIDAISFSAGTILPVELADFSLTQEEKEVQLDWMTSSESGNRGFEVERGTDGRNFTAIGWVDGAGDAVDINTYQFVDQNLMGGVTYYYRLRQVDFDGAFAYSNILTARVEGNTGGEVGSFYPNPTTAGVSQIDIVTDAEEEWTVTTYDLTGRLVSQRQHTLFPGYNQIAVSFANQRKGIFVVQLNHKDETIRRLVRVD